jgi:hypothetical protein
MHHQGIGADGDVDDRREILRDVIRRHLVDGNREREAAGRIQQRIAVGRRSDDRLGPDDTGCAGAVLDHELLPEALAQPLGDEARHHVHAAAGRYRNNDPDRTLGIFGSRHADVTRKKERRPGGIEQPGHATCSA